MFGRDIERLGPLQAFLRLLLVLRVARVQQDLQKVTNGGLLVVERIIPRDAIRIGDDLARVEGQPILRFGGRQQRFDSPWCFKLRVKNLLQPTQGMIELTAAGIARRNG